MNSETLDPQLLASWSGGEWQNGTPSQVVGFGNDTRTLRANEVFAAFETSQRDGHDFLETAKANGASGALVTRFQSAIDLPQLVVANVGIALEAMAKAYRRLWKMPVVGITGSCGKTTCKDLLTAMLGGERVLSTRGNLNNLIGVPLSILRPKAASAQYAVLEAGISEKGEMAQLAEMIDPDFVIVTAIGPAHLEDLETEQTVAVEKGMLSRSERVKTVFAGETCERYAGYLGGVKVEIVKASLERNYEFGLGFASNYALAKATASTLGLSDNEIENGMLTWKPSPMRGEWKEFEGMKVYLDCYNANPLSMKDSLNTFVEKSPEGEPRLFVIGCMEELGNASAVYHEELGIEFPLRNQDTLLVIGAEAESVLRGLKNSGKSLAQCHVINEIGEARTQVNQFEGNVFLKGSRRYHLEDALGGERLAHERKGARLQC